MNTRVFCNDYVTDHPTVQVRQEGSFATLSILGLLNGFFGVRDDGMGPICVETEKDQIIKFKKTPEVKIS